MASIADTTESACRNCGTPLAGTFCYECGQKDDDYHRPAVTLAGEVLQDTLSLDARFTRTLPALFLRPGSVMRAWSDGRRRQFASPFRIYVAMSLVYFLTLGLIGAEGITFNMPDPATVQLEFQNSEGETPAYLAAIRDRLMSGLEAARIQPEAFNDKFDSFLPRIVILMVPVLALLLGLFYLFSRRYFIDHLVFSFYVHATALLLLALANIAALTPLSQSVVHIIGRVAFFGLIAITVISARNNYAQGFVTTILKWLAIGVLYAFLLGLATSAAVFLALAEIGGATLTIN